MKIKNLKYKNKQVYYDNDGIFVKHDREYIMDSLVPTDKEIDIPGIGTKHDINTDIKFKMVDVPLKGIKFPSGLKSDKTKKIKRNFQISETQITNELALEILNWANRNVSLTLSNSCLYIYNRKILDFRYSDIKLVDNNLFLDISKNNHPLTGVSWYGSIFICNWLTEKIDGNSNNCVYEISKQFKVTKDYSKTGFRLPTHKEWESSARYTETKYLEHLIKKSGVYWTPGDYASGATADINNATETGAVAWYDSNSKNTSHKVKTKRVNGLGLYDMSGNVWEWVFDEDGFFRVKLGGNWFSDANFLRVGYRYSHDADDTYVNLGFRFARTLV